MKKSKRIIKEREKRNIEEFEKKLMEFLELIFEGPEPVTDIDISKKMKLPKRQIWSLAEYAKNNEYIKIMVVIVKKELYEGYKIEKKGIEALINWKKIKENKKRNCWIAIATIVIAVSAMASFILSYTAITPQVHYLSSYYCPGGFYVADNYTRDVQVPIKNLGGYASTVFLTLKGKNVEGVSLEQARVIDKGGEYPFSAKIKIKNSDLNESNFYFEINYKKFLFFYSKTPTKSCHYEKDQSGNFDLKQ